MFFGAASVCQKVQTFVRAVGSSRYRTSSEIATRRSGGKHANAYFLDGFPDALVTVCHLQSIGFGWESSHYSDQGGKWRNTEAFSGLTPRQAYAKTPCVMAITSAR